ncbi:CD2 antigen cytoplasmic tail-binding protein 2 homolog [Sabethes cyaneus]|uniref:CD2 antigen cytoplasmic tail-binding protein 2 homolog n=1 Tax=Sabethes cyaneus TaxID=53552 RepID=UPI00237E9AFF|nr:CD2 antigen cytoplasmic tail-binding protein 2 homolog [Sabethes cyaneus]
MSKRNATVVAEEDNYLDDLVRDQQSNRPSSSKHTLDSDEEDSGDDDAQYVLNDNDIEGEEEGIARVDGETKFTPFNMKEEMEEGHFDADGHYLWKKGAEIRDNWLDNIDWVKLKNDPNYKDKKDAAVKGLGDSDSEDDDEKLKTFDLSATYRSIFNMMEPTETIKKALQRIGKKTAKLTTAQRWKMRKAGTIDESSEMVTKLTALANEILTREGNMDIYDETYEMIQKKLNESKANAGDELDMYADDFDSKEKDKLVDGSSGNEACASEAKPSSSKDKNDESKQPLMWEYKEQQNAEAIIGPFTTEQMRQFAEEGKFSSGAFVRKVSSDDSRFYSAARIDFDLYL